MELRHDALNVLSHHLALLLVRGLRLEYNLRLVPDNLRPCLNDRVDQPRLHPVPWIVVPESDAKAAQNRLYLPELSDLSAALNLYHWQGVELSSLWPALLGAPLHLLYVDFLVRLAVVFKHLHQRIGPTMQREVLNLDQTSDAFTQIDRSKVIDVPANSWIVRLVVIARRTAHVYKYTTIIKNKLFYHSLFSCDSVTSLACT